MGGSEIGRQAGEHARVHGLSALPVFRAADAPYVSEVLPMANSRGIVKLTYS